MVNDHGDSAAAREKTRGGAVRHYAVAVLLFAAFVLLVEHYFGWGRLLAPWRGLSRLQLASAILVILISYAIRSIRLSSYFRLRGRREFALCLKVTLQHNLLNNLLPMRTGELSFPVLLRRHFAISPVRSLPALLWFRLLDLHTLVTIALAALGQDYLNGVFLILLLVAWNVLPYLAFRGAGALRARLDAGAGGGLAARMLAALPGEMHAFWSSWWWSVLNWLVKLAAFAWVLRLFIEIPLPAAVLGAIGGEVTSVLPVHGLAGLGTYEGGVVAMLLPFGIGADQALTGAVNLHLVLLLATLISGLASLFIRGRDR